jgi:ferredoxin-NADP reductase
MSILRQADAMSLPTTLVACFRTCEEIIFREELTRLPQIMPHLTVRIVVEEADATWIGLTGRPTPELIAQSAGPMLARARVHLCGPRAMMEAVKGMLTELGVAREQVHTEDFAPAAGANAARERAIAKAAEATTPIRAYNATFSGVGRTARAAPGQSLLDAALAEGVTLRHTCGSAGACGNCRVRIGKGDFETGDPNNLLTARERSEGWVLACHTYPTGDVTVAEVARR